MLFKIISTRRYKFRILIFQSNYKYMIYIISYCSFSAVNTFYFCIIVCKIYDFYLYNIKKLLIRNLINIYSFCHCYM